MLGSVSGIQLLSMTHLREGKCFRTTTSARSRIKVLQFDCCRASVGSMATLVESCRALESLSISWLPYVAVDIRRLSKSISQHAATLRTLRLSSYDLGFLYVIPFLENLTNLWSLDIDEHFLTGGDPLGPNWPPLPVLPSQLQHLDVASGAPPADFPPILEGLAPHLQNLACIRVRLRRFDRTDFTEFIEKKEIRHGLRFREDKPWLISCSALEDCLTFDCARTDEKSVRDSFLEVAAELANKGMLRTMRDYFLTGQLAYRPRSCCRVYEKELSVRYPRRLMDVSYITSPDEPAGELAA
ncbi:uncharacterized protein RHO25_007979 [Cercospora beticola]|nr:hypothetical protein RHO25_007979 [Cercospora beticola]